MSVPAVRLASRDQPDVDDDFRYEFAAALKRDGSKWPKGRFALQAYDSNGVLMSRVAHMELTKTLDKDVRQLSASFYCPALASAELLFEAETGRNADEWESIDVRVQQGSAGALGLVLRGFKAEAHPDFEASNLVLVRVAGQIVAESGLPLPRGLCLAITIVGGDESVLSSNNVDLSVGPSTFRAVEQHTKIYDHQDPAFVLIEPFTV